MGSAINSRTWWRLPSCAPTSAQTTRLKRPPAKPAPRVPDRRGSPKEHWVRAIDRSLTAGAHGLPLIGTGDWNDGMNRVGSLGRGESTWLGWFLYTVLGRFAPLCEARGDGARAAGYRSEATRLAQVLELA